MMNRFVFLAFADVLVQLVGFLLATCLQTEKFYDLTGKKDFRTYKSCLY